METQQVEKLTMNEALEALKLYPKYKYLSDYAIKKMIGGHKLANVSQVRAELKLLTVKEKKLASPTKTKMVSPTKTKMVSPTKTKMVSPTKTNIVLPEDVLLQTLLHSDLKTIVNICTTSKNTEKLCNAHFWMQKFNMDHLPLLETPNNFQDWSKLYRDVSDAQKQAKQMIHVIKMFNRYKGNSTIMVWYDKTPKDITEKLSPYLNKIKQMGVTAINYIYNRKTDSWNVELDQSDKSVPIKMDVMIDILTTEIYKSFHGYDIKFNDDNINQLLYTLLLKRAKQNKPFERTYLMGYELMNECKI